MIFLGAGASVPFGIPTMSEFTDKITESLSNTNNKEWQNELLKIKAGLQTKRLRYDIEIIATSLSIFSNTSVNTSYLAPFFAFSENLMPSSRPELTGLLSEIKTQIYKICRRFNRTDAYTSYRSLFSSLENVGSTKVDSSGSEHFLCPVNYQIFTTNYDLSFNKFLETEGKDYNDGFSGTDGTIPIFSDRWGDYTSINFGKLHGSISYYEHENGSIVRYPIALNEEDVSDEKIVDKMMIYPIGEKYATRTPYIEILSRFRNTLIEEKVVIVIGYSFRDDPINNAFVDRVTRYRKKKFKIIVVDPDVESIKDYLPDALKQVVTPIKAEFGNNNCGNLIASAIENRPPGDIANV